MAPVCWSSLPGELVRHVADTFLATNDIDYYMNLHAVCHNWRDSTEDGILLFEVIRDKYSVNNLSVWVLNTFTLSKPGILPPTPYHYLIDKDVVGFG